MTAYSIFETLVVGAIVATCLVGALGKLAPRTRARLQGSAGVWMERPGHPGWVQALGHRWALRSASADAGCGSGCSTCGSCETPAPAVEQVVRVERKRQGR